MPGRLATKCLQADYSKQVFLWKVSLLLRETAHDRKFQEGEEGK